VFTPRDNKRADGQQVTTWKATSTCRYGACDFRVRSSSGAEFKYELDGARGEFRRTYTGRVDCENQSTGKSLIKGAYKTRSRQVLKAAASVVSADRTTYATELAGTHMSRSTLKPAAVGKCKAQEKPEIQDIRVVRIDRPSGKPAETMP